MNTPLTFEQAWANPTNREALRRACRRFRQFSADEIESIQLVAVWRALRTYRPTRASFAAYVRAAAYRGCVVELRRLRRQRINNRLLYENELTVDASERYHIGGRQPLPPLQYFSLKTALASLSPTDRSMFVDRVLGRMTFAELADRYNCSHTAAFRRIEQIKKDLRKALCV